MALSAVPRYELCFCSLYQARDVFAFPCNAQGLVDLDALSEPARNNYLYARAMIGREFGYPSVKPAQPAA